MVSVSVVMPNTSTTYVHLKIRDLMFCMYVGPIPYIVKSRWNAFTTIVRNQRCNISFGNSIWQHAYYSTDSSGTLSRYVLMYENIITLAVACKALQWSAHQHCQRRVNNSVIKKSNMFLQLFGGDGRRPGPKLHESLTAKEMRRVVRPCYAVLALELKC